ncbi:serine-pyruvate aminotransferase/archaeal aspartate aminotransferase [Halovivax ruber XH-70]|uniref:Serine-pyruvate aminotransferase/archaeal aspartate aminotransferase n=1 Tax=Halovivax ruber (strain DSM 18193 / JCM 13892 / XH-70) TaxID=797302 RepID=L0I8K9_HALRX|nr:alanine--glyoxylate aminotransferase family protein [Halovivax ruber]AGB15148.1 serine-pyruvate aminotransferase/archaeal aspartate aminotransferase [Halovivax ruber XH-70]
MLFTPGPTAVPPSVREAMAEPQPNPDLDPAFRDRYRDLCAKLARVYDTDHDVVVLGGEGILGLEAAIASLVDPGDRVLCVSNGLYGDGFADFVESYDGDPELVSGPFDDGYDLDAVETALEDAAAAGEPFGLATMVHCETPTGTLNDLEPVLDLLDEYDVLSVVDAVSSLGGTSVPTERIDVCLGGSQKCFSAPPGLTTAAISDRAWEHMESREPTSLYTNFLPWRDVSDGFPYTHLDANVAALDAAVDLVLDEGVEGVYARHEAAAERCRERGAELGLDLYPDAERASPTVTAFSLPGDAARVQRRVAADEDVVLATGLGEMADDILRVGHMGYNADVEKVDRAMDAVEAVLDGSH